MLKEKLRQISRRDLFRLAGQYGWSSTLLAAGAMTGAITLPRLAEAANSTYDKRFSSEPKHKLKFGAAGFNERNLLIERAGCLQFVNDLEERSDGAIRVEFIGNNQICGQLNCVKKTQQGIVDIYAASTQNSAGGAPGPPSTISCITRRARRSCAIPCARSTASSSCSPTPSCAASSSA
jgi:hypothetical protein